MNQLLSKPLLASAVTVAGLTMATVSVAEEIPVDISRFLDNYWSETDTFPFECRFLFHPSSFQMPRCMKAANVISRLDALQEIADLNNNTRAAGLEGYDASVDYIKTELTRMGYEVTLNGFDFNAFYERSDGMLTALAPEALSYEWNVDFTYMEQTEAGDVTGVVEAVDLDLGVGNGSTSGCEPEDFAGFTPGNIALIQRGACTFQAKAENAAAAGAVGAIIFNQGNSDSRKGLIDGTLGAEYTGGIPVFFSTYGNGVVWSETKGWTLNMVADVLREKRTVNNVIAETPMGNPDNIVMLGAHLDSVAAGPGINDNGSGSAAILELANLMKHTWVHNKIRFAWWGAEESGLVGSTDYVQHLSEEELAKIKVYLNFDMIGSPNFYNGIYDGDGSDFGLKGPAGSAATETLFEKYFALRGQPFEGSEISFRSDYAQFFEDGIAFGGLFTGAESLKTKEQAAIYGGEAGVAFDECYHAKCDDIGNLNERAIEVNADAIAYVTALLANSTKVIDNEITAAEEVPEDPTIRALNSMMYDASSFDKTHWGKHWIK
jgi:Zn-dependent M28 family amino/carboxypeptidase